MTFVDIDQVENLKSVDMANLVALFECSASILNHHTTCLLLDHLKYKVQDVYWQEFDNYYNVNSHAGEDFDNTDQHMSETSVIVWIYINLFV